MSFSVCAGVRRISLRTIWIQIAAGLLAYNAAADSAFISVPLQRTSLDTDASGFVRIILGQTNSSLTLQASNLTAGRPFTVLSGGLVRGRFIADASGHGQLRFARPSAPGALPFDFDPRGKQLMVVENVGAVLRARISGPGEPRGSVVDEQVRLPALPGTAGGTADTKYELLADGTRRFSVTLTNVGSATFNVFVDGIRRGRFTTSGGTGAIAFDNAAATPEPALNFDPRGFVIDIVKSNILRFSGKFQAKAEGINLATPAVITRFIPATTVSPNGIALARRFVDRNARREFDVELFNVPVGDYTLFVNGVFQGFIPVFAGPFGTEGEIQFSTDPDDEDERWLSFNAFTSFYMIQGPGGLFFEGQPVVGSIQLTNAGSLLPSEIELPLFNRGVDADGTARAQLKTDDRGRRHFEIELKNVPTGDYFTVLINDVPTGIIQVVTEPTGTRGLIEFEDEPEEGERLLTFDPLGKVIGVERRRTRYFDRAFPSTP